VEKIMKIPTLLATPPTKEELRTRLEKVRKKMSEQNLDNYIAFNPKNIYYLTNFANNVHERPFILVIPKTGIMKFLMPKLEKTHIETRALCELELEPYYEFPAPEGKNWFDVYRTLVEKDARVGYESILPVYIFNQTPGTKILTDIINEVRFIKSDYEIGRLAFSSYIVSQGHKNLFEIGKPGLTIGEIMPSVTQCMTEILFSRNPDVNVVVSSGGGAVWPPHISHDPHLIPKMTDKLIKGGPHVSIIYGLFDGYGAEVERTFFYGEIPDNCKKPFQTMIQARQCAYDMLKPGANMSEIDLAVQKIIIQAGYGDYIIHRTGHSFGVTDHEAPFLAAGYNRIVESNMVFSIEPGIYIPGVGGFRHSDTVLVTEEGCLSLTEAPDKLEDLIFKI
jgi:Xaa-Pro dipeptidase